MRLYVLVEGPTEVAFVKRVLYPHLVTVGLWSTPIIVETRRDPGGSKYRGGGDWSKWRRDLVRLTKGHPGKDVRFTTLFDLYGLPMASLRRSRGSPSTGAWAIRACARSGWRRRSQKISETGA